jgi:predicted TIM-barrel fold metal-dependent hydrolase
MVRGLASFLLLVAGCVHRYEGPVIDVHAHLVGPEQLGSYAPGVGVGTGPLLAHLATTQVKHSALIVIAQAGDLPATRALNDHVLTEAVRSGGRLFPVGSVHPDDGELALAELDRLQGLGFKMVKLHPNTQHFDVASTAVAAVIERCGALGLVVLFDGYSPFDANQPGKLAVLAITHPKTKLILAHLGGPTFDAFGLFAMFEHYRFPYWQRNVWFDLSATADFFADSPYAEQLRWLVRKIGVDRVLFGSDYPVDLPAHAIDDVVRLGFTEDEQRQIFFANASALLGLDP